MTSLSPPPLLRSSPAPPPASPLPIAASRPLTAPLSVNPPLQVRARSDARHDPTGPAHRPAGDEGGRLAPTDSRRRLPPAGGVPAGRLRCGRAGAAPNGPARVAQLRGGAGPHRNPAERHRRGAPQSATSSNREPHRRAHGHPDSLPDRSPH
eukprot:978011-Prorocentrum_minimum.AAC.2